MTIPRLAWMYLQQSGVPPWAITFFQLVGLPG